MARIPIPEGDGAELDRVWDIHPEMGEVVLELRNAVYTKNTLPIRIQEAVRYFIGTVNQCPTCVAARASGDGSDGLTERFYESIKDYRTSPELDQRERLALEYTDLFCNDHLAIDDALFDTLREHFSDVEVLDLCVTVSRHLGFGRLTPVLQLSVACAAGTAPLMGGYWSNMTNDGLVTEDGVISVAKQ